jgi:diadenosine tetraphosphatase ApaH/serine/threonine PP2A family protein phosphatase
MRYLIFSDLHANLDAFEAVLGAAPAADRILILGDIVGYGAEPNAVIDRVRALEPALIIRGNHDKVASGLEMPDSFNPAALQSAAWTFDKLTGDNRAWLYAIPPGPAEIDETIEICHGSPEDEDEYLFSAADAGRVFPSVRRPVCFFGHTHVAVSYSTCANFKEVELQEPDHAETSTIIGIKPRRHYLINPGAVGQPRDGDPRAAYGYFDTSTQSVELRRVPYDVARAQQRIRAAGLPDVLARRLGLGR